MEFRVETLAPCRKKVRVVVPAERVREEVDGQYRELNNQIALPGFRPGKAPRKVLEARFGAHIRDEVKEKLVEAAVQKAVEEKQVAPLGRPTLDVGAAVLDPEKAFEFEFEVTTRPDFDLPTWKGREVKVPAVTVSDADVDAGIERLRAGEGTLEASTAPLAADDVAVVDWRATSGAEALHAEEGSYYRVGRGVLDGLVVEGLDAALLGKSAGASATGLRARAAPGDPRGTLAGKEFEVAIEVKDAKRFKPAELDAAFLKRHDFDDVDELKKDVRRRILRAKERDRDRLAEDRLVEALVAEAKIPLPEDVVANAVEGWAERRRIEAQAEGLDLDEVAKETAASREQVKASVEADLRRHFVLDRIAEAEGLQPTEQEVVGAIEQMARDSGRSTGELIEHFEADPGRVAELRAHLRHGKAREALRRAAVVVEEASPAAGA